MQALQERLLVFIVAVSSKNVYEVLDTSVLASVGPRVGFVDNDIELELPQISQQVQAVRRPTRTEDERGLERHWLMSFRVYSDNESICAEEDGYIRSVGGSRHRDADLVTYHVLQLRCSC